MTKGGLIVMERVTHPHYPLRCLCKTCSLLRAWREQRLRSGFLPTAPPVQMAAKPRPA
jgi:hypothetical protein